MPPSTQVGRNLARALATATEFSMGTADVQRAAARLARALDELGIPYAIAGGLAVAAHGHLRTTVDIDVLLSAQGLRTFKERWLGRGWIEKFPGSRGLRDTEHRVDIDVLLTGGFPGDGKPKAIAFPEPTAVAEVTEAGRVLLLPVLIELKLASGLSAPHRLQDFADVIALIRVNDLPADYSRQLHPDVRPKFVELWQYAQVRDQEV